MMDENHIEMPDNIEGGPYRPVESDFEPSPPKTPGPLEMRPGWVDLLRTIRFYALIVIASAMYWRGELRSFAVSGQAVFVDQEYWRLFSAIFVHSDLGHLMSNTLLLIIFGWFLRFHFGSIAFPLTALVVGAAANLVTVYFYPLHTRLVGASGMIYGMVALWLVWYIRYDSGRPLTVRIVRAIAFSLVVMFPTTFHETTSYLAHAAGFGIGLVVAFIMLPVIRPRGRNDAMTPPPFSGSPNIP